MALPKPVGRQHEVVYLPSKGHQVVLGTAGSGKTSMAILRAALLSNAAFPGSGKTLLITFNNTLSSYLRFLAADVIDAVTVENFHKFARGYLGSRDEMTGSSILPTSRYTKLVEEAVLHVAQKHDPHAFFSRPTAFFKEEIRWLSRHAITTEAGYIAVERTGRADARMPRSLRPTMWQIRERYRALRAEAGYAYDVDEIAVDVEQALNGDSQPRLYRHVIIDEGQDLSPAMLRALSKAVPVDGSLTLFGDVAQQIYGRQMSWRSAGLNPVKIWQFEENYRNTKAIAKLAVAVSQMPYYSGEADLVVPKQPAADGPKPTLVSCKDEATEFAFVERLALDASKSGSVAILTRTNSQARAFQKSMSAARQLHDTMSAWTDGPGISIGTLHNGKGLEFDTVILPHLSDDQFPHPLAVENDGPEEAAAVEGRLLYVGITRARSALLLTFCGQRTALLPIDPSLYAEISR